jgi:signal transduction histidine kinase
VDLAELKEIVADIRRDNVRASEVILRLRSLLKKVPFQPKDADLNQIVNETVEFLSALAVARRVEIRTSMTPALLPILGDRIQLQQVILNLIVNAMDAMANMPVAERQIRVSTTLVDDFAEVAVFDDGPGVPGDKLKEVFEPFFTTKKSGMGMGLSIARTIVEAHEGQMSVENQPSGGAAFRFRLPLAA